MSRYMKGLAIQDQPIPATRLQAETAASHVQNSVASQDFSTKSAHEDMEQREMRTSANDLYQKPLPNLGPTENGARRKDHIIESTTNTTNNRSSDSGQTADNEQLPQETPVTALTSVVLPALEAALHRRSYQLSLLQKKQNMSQTSRSANGDANGSTIDQDILAKRQTHEQIRKCMNKASRLFREIDHWDSVAPVGMGDGVEGLLEGFLEEVLCRVEAEDV